MTSTGLIVVKVLALVFLALAAIKCPEPRPWVSWGWLGALLAFGVLMFK